MSEFSMNADETGRFRPTGEERIVSNNVLAMLIFLTMEVMFFAALMSAYLIASAKADGAWPPVGQPRLPIMTTAFNSIILFFSAGFLHLAYRTFSRNQLDPLAKKFYLGAMLFGGFFLAFQGSEWIRLISYGLTLTSSAYGSYFYLIIGMHALHVTAALVTLGYVYRGWLKQEAISQDSFAVVRLFWYFVVGLWPVLYFLVYLQGNLKIS